jgi:hypothetical protein
VLLRQSRIQTWRMRSQSNNSTYERLEPGAAAMEQSCAYLPERSLCVLVGGEPLRACQLDVCSTGCKSPEPEMDMASKRRWSWRPGDRGEMDLESWRLGSRGDGPGDLVIEGRWSWRSSRPIVQRRRCRCSEATPVAAAGQMEEHRARGRSPPGASATGDPLASSLHLGLSGRRATLWGP